MFHPALRLKEKQLKNSSREAKKKDTTSSKLPPITSKNVANAGANKYKSIEEALNDPAYLAKIKAAKNNKVSIEKTVKMSTKDLIPPDKAAFEQLTPDDISLSKGQPLHVIKTEKGYVVLDGKHRLRDALKEGKDSVDVKVFSKDDAISRYGDDVSKLFEKSRDVEAGIPDIKPKKK